MYVKQVRRKKISLFLLILITLFIIALIFTVIHIFNNSKANSDLNINENMTINLSAEESENKISNTNNKISSNLFNNFNDFNDFVEISTNNNQSENTINQQQNSLNNNISEPTEVQNTELELNSHKYEFNNTEKASLITENSNQYIQIKKSTCILNINTDTLNYSSLKTQKNLKSFLSKNYNLNITGDIKTGKIKNIDIIVFAFSENNSIGYFIISPLNDTEIIYSKVYNIEDASILIKDLSEPIDEISSIIANSIK